MIEMHIFHLVIPRDCLRYECRRMTVTFLDYSRRANIFSPSTQTTRASTPGVSMGGHPAGITVDAVREQLAALGHDDVSDDVIASFLDSLMAHQVNEVNVAPLPVENVAAANGADDAPPPPVEGTDALTRGHSPEATAARTPGGTERAPCLTSPEPDGTREGSRRSRTTPNDDAVPNRRATPPTGARPAPTSSGRRAATRSVALAIPTVITPAVTPGDASRTPPDRLLTPNSSATRHRRDQSKSPKDLVHEDIIGWCAKRSVASVTPGRVTGGNTTRSRRTGHNSSVIASPMPIRAGVGTPGQRVRIDRVARAAQYAAVWSGDAYLERRRAGDRGGGGKSAVTSVTSAGNRSGAASCVDFLDADEATVFGTRSKLAYDRYPDRYPAAYDVNGVRGGSWGRAQRKLTDGTNEWRVDVERGEREKENTRRVSTSGFWDDSKRGLKAGAKGATGKGFKTPDERRRDALRWEVRARMAAPPTF